MRQIDWDHMRVLLAIHRAGSLRGAAEALGVNHATVSRALRGLEEGLGTRLFDRSTAGLTLTQPCEELIPYAEDMESRMMDVRRRLTGLDAEPRGIVRVTMPPSFVETFLAPVLKGFSDLYPEIDIHVIATNEITDLSRHEADVSLRAANSINDDLVGQRLLDYVNSTFAAPDYLAAHPDLVATKGKGAYWIGWGGTDRWALDTHLPKARVRHRLPEVQMQLEAAAQGLGMANVPAFMGDAHPGVVRVPGVPVEPGRGVWVLLHGDLRRTARVRAFVDYVAKAIRAKRRVFTE